VAARELIGGGDQDGTAAQWGSLCERFHDIRLGAYRHDLAGAWRRVATADTDAPGMLTAWQDLDEQIRRLDVDEWGNAVRNAGGDSDGDDDWDDWDSQGDEYACPVGKCDRRVRSALGIPPRCELLRRDMTRLRAQPDA